MNTKLPPDSFTYYYGLGSDRSYQAVADQFGVSKRAVTSRATKESWQERIREIERKAREKADQQIQETLEDMNGRHLKMLRVIQGKALEALKTMPMNSAIEAARALDMTIRQERIIRGEPGDRAEIDVWERVKREQDRWLPVSGDEEPGNGRSEP